MSDNYCVSCGNEDKIQKMGTDTVHVSGNTFDEKADNVNHPSHYTAYKGVEIIDIAEGMNFNLGNAVKYIARAGLKDKTKEIEDLKKALWYVKRQSLRNTFNIVSNVPLELAESLVRQMSYYRGLAVWHLIGVGRIGNEIETDLRVAAEYLDCEIRWTLTDVTAKEDAAQRELEEHLEKLKSAVTNGNKTISKVREEVNLPSPTEDKLHQGEIAVIEAYQAGTASSIDIGRYKIFQLNAHNNGDCYSDCPHSHVIPPMELGREDKERYMAHFSGECMRSGFAFERCPYTHDVLPGHKVIPINDGK